MTGNGIPDPMDEADLEQEERDHVFDVPDEAPLGELPEGVGIEDVEEHAVTLKLAGELINHTSAYLGAEPGSAEEGQAERLLAQLASKISDAPKAAGSVLLCLASIIVNTGEQDAVQAWFTEQAEHVKAALDAR